VFDRVVDDLPAAHLFTEIRERDATRLIDDGNDQRVRVLTGTLVTTYEYSLAGSMEIGLGGGAAPRKQGQWFHALGPVAVVVLSKVVLPLQASSDAPALLAGFEEEGFDKHPCGCELTRFRVFCPYRSLLGSRCPPVAQPSPRLSCFLD
jgi:hypothetical protein